MPELEEREAARFNGYTWKGWLELPRTERMDGIAYLRISRQIELHQQDARERERRRQEQQAQRTQRGRRR